MVFVKSQNELSPGVGQVQLCNAQSAVENPPESIWGEPRGDFVLIFHPW